MRLKYFFHFAGRTKYIGNCMAEQIPFKIPKDKNDDLNSFFENLENDDDVQNIYSNVEFEN